MNSNDVKLAMLVEHEKKLDAIKNWIDITHKEIELLDEFMERILELNKDDSLHILEHEHRLSKLEAILDERCE